MGKYRSPFDKSSKVNTPFMKKGSAWSLGYHTGVDLIPIDGSKNPKLYSITDGKVQAVNSKGASYGNHVVIQTTDGNVFLMAHMRDKPLVKVGQSVKAGQQIGVMGNTGNSFGEHLHLEIETSKIWYFGKNLVDPTNYIDLKKYSNSDVTATNIVDDFINEAMKHKGEDGTWTWNTMKIAVGTAWCAAFICAVAKTVGKILNYVIYNSTWVEGIVEEGVKKNYGTYYRGPFYGSNPTPKKGDLITFGYGKSSDGYDHIEIVTSVSNDTVTTVGGNSGSSGSRYNKVKVNTYQRTNTTISGYYRPNWSSVDYTYDDSDSVSKLSPLYDHLNDRNDMTLREVGYMNFKNKPSISTSNIGLAVINYTTMLYNIFEIVADTGSPTNNYNTDNLSSGPKNVVNYLIDKGLNTAASIGIAANIKYESNFNTASIGDNGTSFGICQWHLGRGKKMKEMAGSNWKNNLTGQLDYLWYELNHGYKYSTLVPLQGVPNTKSGAKKAADIFVRKFEIPANVNTQSEKRQEQAEEYWDKLVPQLR